jgi:general secretion pathway protein G
MRGVCPLGSATGPGEDEAVGTPPGDGWALSRGAGWTLGAAVALIFAILVSLVAVAHRAVVEARMATARSQLQSFADALAIHHRVCGKFPETLERLAAMGVSEPPAEPIEDPYGRPYEYRRDGRFRVRVRCLGSDGVSGGIEEAADSEVVADSRTIGGESAPPRGSAPRESLGR